MAIIRSETYSKFNPNFLDAVMHTANAVETGMGISAHKLWNEGHH